MTSTSWNDFKGAAKRISDIDIPRIAHKIKVGEDELHAFMDVETSGNGFDNNGRPKILFEPHVFYRNLKGAKRTRAVKEGLAYPTWGEKPYPRDSYPRLIKAMLIDETSALKAASWGLGQILGENHEMVGYRTPQDMVRAFMDDEAAHLDAMVNFLVSAKIDGEMRKLAALTRKTTAADCEKIVSVYNGPGYKKNRYHTKMASAHNKWRAIKDTPWSPEGNEDAAVAAPVNVPWPTPKPVAQNDKLVEHVQDLLWDKGYPEVGESDNKFGKRTRNAILAFQADNDLPLTGEITDELLAQLIKAPKREMTNARQDATAKDLKAEPVVKEGSWLKKIGLTILGMSSLGGLSEGKGTLDDISNGVSQFRNLFETLQPILPWLLMGGAGVAVFVFGRRAVNKYVEAYREGRAL
ncbi:N-acetylmuramidase domain-containing protein [Rhizobium nepotum]|uniref:N-acetylmuramidase domain-containing protein n=1 Tax=Rhizobium nepotum TaxID=1035271 RepID=UPI003CF99C1D